MKHQKNRSDTVKLDCVQSTSKVLAISKCSLSFQVPVGSSPQCQYTTVWINVTQQFWQLQNQNNAGFNIKVNTNDTKASQVKTVQSVTLTSKPQTHCP